MAFLLLLHQKMRLQRKQNQLTLKQLRFTSLVERMQKKVDKREKYYAKLEKQLERQANYYKNNANMFFSQQMGLGTNSVNLGNPYGANGATMGILQSMSQSQMEQVLKQCSGGQLDFSNFSDTAWSLIKNGGIQTRVGENGKTEYIDWNGSPIDESKLSKTGSGVDAAAVNRAASLMQQMAQMQVSNMQTQMSQMKSNYENNVSIWLEAQQEQLEAQKEWEMDLLAEEQADLEADKTSVEAQLELVKQEKQSIEQALGQAIQEAAPKFGLA